MAQGTLIEHVPKNTEGKYGHGKGVAAQARVAIEEPSEYLVVVFLTRDRVPKYGIKCNR